VHVTVTERLSVLCRRTAERARHRRPGCRVVDSEIIRPYQGGIDPQTSYATTTREQDAVRLLMLLRHAGDRAEAGDAQHVGGVDPDAVVATIQGEQRLQAMDFWLRNPDYLADELLDLYEVTGDPSHVRAARRIILDEEPDLRTYPMLRYRYGAWERLDDSMGLLRTYGLATDSRRGAQLLGRRDFFLLARGDDAAVDLVTRVPELAWYADRAKLVRAVAGDTGGTELKLRQKLQNEYVHTTWLTPIGSIRARVQLRIESLRDV
jgi:hypothetical protein